MEPIEFKGELTSKNINQYLVDYAEKNGYEYSTDADVIHNKDDAAKVGAESALPSAVEVDPRYKKGTGLHGLCYGAEGCYKGGIVEGYSAHKGAIKVVGATKITNT